MAERNMEDTIGYQPENPDYVAEQFGDIGSEGLKDPEELSSDLGAPGVNEALGRNPFELTDEQKKEIEARKQVGLDPFDNSDQADRRIPIDPADVTPEMRRNALGSPDNPNSIYNFQTPTEKVEQ